MYIILYYNDEKGKLVLANKEKKINIHDNTENNFCEDVFFLKHNGNMGYTMLM